MNDLSDEDSEGIEAAVAGRHAGEDHEKSVEWQSGILAGRPEPEGPSERDSTRYDRLKEQLDAAGRPGHAIDFPGDSTCAAPTRPADAPAAGPADTPLVPPTGPMPLVDYGEEYLRALLALTDEEIRELRREHQGERTYRIVAQHGTDRLLADCDAPARPARIWSPREGLSPIHTLESLIKSETWERYDGPQDALKDLVPDDCIPSGAVPLELQSPERPPGRLAGVYPDTDVMRRMLLQIVNGNKKPEGLAAHESAAWDELAADVAEAREKGYIIEIPPE